VSCGVNPINHASVKSCVVPRFFRRAGATQCFRFHGGAELHDFFKHRGHGVGYVGRNDVVDFRMRFFEQRARRNW